MKIYDYLFYKSYLLAKKSGNFNDVPVLGGLIFVIACVMFNLFALSFLLESIWNFDYHISKKVEIPIAIILLGSVWFYYLYKGRYKRILEKYENLNFKINLHPIIVIILYFGTSFTLGMIAAMYKNQNWIFTP